MILLRRVVGLSMAPTFMPGKFVFAWRLGKPKVGDVVIVRHHQLELIKRVNQIEDGRLYVLGDNPDESTDSREYGWLPMASVLGVVLGALPAPAQPQPDTEPEA